VNNRTRGAKSTVGPIRKFQRWRCDKWHWGCKKPFQSKVLISFTLTRRKPSVGIHLLHEQNPPRVSSPPNAWIITSSSLHGHIFLSQPRSTRTPSSSHGRPPASTTPTTVEGHDLAGFPDRQSQR